MLVRRKYQLPTMWKFQDKKFNLERLRDEAIALGNDYGNVMETNKALCSNNCDLVESVYKHFKQVNLTEFNPDHKAPTLEECRELCDTAGTGDHTLTRSQKYKLRTQRTDQLDPALDERNYNKPTENFTGSYFEEVVNSFKSDAIRVRLVRLDPGKTLSPHIDYDPTYAIRVIVPIFAEEEATNYFWRKGKTESFHLVPDGSAYFLNIGLRHTVINTGTRPRISLMFSLKDQQDIQEIPEQDWNSTTSNMGNMVLSRNYDEHKVIADAQPVAV